jgi:hypothetical protein
MRHGEHDRRTRETLAVTPYTQAASRRGLDPLHSESKADLHPRAFQRRCSGTRA